MNLPPEFEHMRQKLECIKGVSETLAFGITPEKELLMVMNPPGLGVPVGIKLTKDFEEAVRIVEVLIHLVAVHMSEGVDNAQKMTDNVMQRMMKGDLNHGST